MSLCRATLCLLLVALSTMSAASSQQPYGKRVRFALNQELVFADFTLRYTGQTHESSTVFPPGFSYENFVVKTGGHEQTVRWSGGTGDIGPAVFKVGRKRFWLELEISERLKMLAQDELVILPAPRR